MRPKFAPHREIFDLPDRVAVVTGAGSGLGRMFASVLAAYGAEVCCLDRDLSTVEETATDITRAGGKAVAAAVDVTDEVSVRAFASMISGQGRTIDILVNNAGVAGLPTRIHEMDDQTWTTAIDVNLSGTFRCTRALLPSMIAGGGGSIVNISSIMGLGGFYPGTAGISAAYNATKAAIVGLTRQLASEYAGDKIRCNAIAPGWHQGTNLGAKRASSASPAATQAFDQAILNGTPLGRRGHPEELRGLMLLLASDASSFITGQVFVQDGGWCAI